MNPRRSPAYAGSQRGSGILLAIIVVLVLAVVGVGVLRFSSRELAGADAGRKREALVACAEAGQHYLLSQFRAVGVSPTALTPIDVDLSGDGNVRVLGGHIDDVTIEQVTLLPSNSMGAESTNDLTNVAFPNLAQLGGKPYRVMVHCVDHGRQLEVEFGVRFGL